MVDTEIHGVVVARLIRNGEVILERTAHNVTCNVGVAAVAATIAGAGNSQFIYIAVGTGTAAVNAADTALTAEVLRQVASSYVATTTSSPNDTAQLTTNFGILSSYAITEAGLFNAQTSGVILGHVLIGTINVNGGDTLQIQWSEVF